MIRSELLAKLREAAKEDRVEPLTDLLIKEAKECVHLFAGNDIDPAEVGASRVGGFPDLPDGVEWPMGRDEQGGPAFAQFVAQIKLADVPQIDDVPLPRSGYLWVFLTSLWDDQGVVGAKVIHDPRANVMLRRCDAPTDVTWVIQEPQETQWSLRFELGVSLPFNRDRFAEDLLEELIEEQRSSGTPEISEATLAGIRHSMKRVKRFASLHRLDSQGRIGGHAYLSEGHDDLLQKTVLTRLGHREPDPKWMEEHLQEVIEEAESWRLLMEIDGGVDYGDGFPLWLFARAADIAAANFDDVAAEGAH